ncbi:hypothetical protein C8R47DRAFT_1114932 [Mycena vitilis]|nr:hypothetical protein C8R47DRAFT_1114932 [Mycena vitilis]
MSPPPPTALLLLPAVWALSAVHTSSLKHLVVARASQPGLVLLARGLKPFLTARSWLARSQALQYPSPVYSRLKTSTSSMPNLLISPTQVTHACSSSKSSLTRRQDSKTRLRLTPIPQNRPRHCIPQTLDAHKMFSMCFLRDGLGRLVQAHWGRTRVVPESLRLMYVSASLQYIILPRPPLYFCVSRGL